MGYRKLGRTASQRKAMLRNLATDVIISGRIETTVTRAKETQKLVDKLVTLGKRGETNIHAIRQAKALLFNAVDENNTLALKKLFSEVAPGYADRNGGYTRVLKLGPRRGDGSEMAIIELV